jgi:hydroxymethylpyrimidine pyrophosphatase-like HAD family hydrolase
MAIVKTEILRLIERLHDMHNIKVSPSVHATKLILFGDQINELIRFIQIFSVIKIPENIRQILLWKLNMAIPENETKDERKGRPLSSLDQNMAETLYNCIFNQRKFLKDLNHPINIILFRRGISGPHLTNILKNSNNINITILVSGTDDSKSWYNFANKFGAPGIPSAGKAMLALANDRAAKEFFSMRIEYSENLFINFSMLVNRLERPGHLPGILNDQMKKIFTAGMRMKADKREIIASYLKAFLEEYRARIYNEGLEAECPISGLPLRSLTILGAYLFKKDLKIEKSVKWQDIVDELSDNIFQISTENNQNKILFLTDERQRLIAIDDKGFIYLSEIALKNRNRNDQIIGIWLINTTIDDRFVHSLLNDIRNLNITIRSNYLVQIKDQYNDYSDQINRTTLLIEGSSEDFTMVAKLIDGRSSSGIESNKRVDILTKAKMALREADLILYSDKHIETSVGAALIVPGAKDAIKYNPTGNKLKVCLSLGSEKDAYRNFESVYRYVTGKMIYNSNSEINWSEENIYQYVDYVVRSINYATSIDDPLNFFTDYFEGIDVYTQYYNSNIKPEHGTYPAKALSEIIIGLSGIARCGFIADQKYGFYKKCYIDMEKNGKQRYYYSSLGMFNNPENERLINQIKGVYSNIVFEGGFVFDVDMTLLPKKSEYLTDYPTLAYYIMLLLRDGHKVGIISGNSQEAQIPRIVNAIRGEMKGFVSSLQNLIFYVDGGATKIEFGEDGQQLRTIDPFNKNHAMKFDELQKAVDNALKRLNCKHSFYLNDVEQEKFMNEAQEKYPGLMLRAAWEHADTWEPTWLTPNELSKNYKKANIPITVPWVETRGKINIDGKEKVASIAIKPTPQLKNKDIRNIIQDEIRKELGDKQKKYFLRSGGTSTTDITQKNADKTAALKDFIVSNRLSASHVYYFGDEFYRRENIRSNSNCGIDHALHYQVGNDEVIAISNDLDLKQVKTIAVNLDNINGANQKTEWIGRSPQAILEFLEHIIPG